MIKVFLWDMSGRSATSSNALARQKEPADFLMNDKPPIHMNMMTSIEHRFWQTFRERYGKRRKQFLRPLLLTRIKDRNIVQRAALR